MKAKNTKKSGNKFDVQCQECGKRFKTASWEPHCPRCNSYDIEPANDGKMSESHKGIKPSDEARRKRSKSLKKYYLKKKKLKKVE